MNVGDKVQNVLSGDWLVIIEVSKDSNGVVVYRCRNKRYEIVELYEFEIFPV